MRRRWNKKGEKRGSNERSDGSFQEKMSSKKLLTIFVFSIPLFITHGIEEYFTGFYKVDDILFGRLSPDISQTAFTAFQLFWWTLLVAIAVGMSKGKLGFKMAVVIGLVYIFELQHLLHAFLDKAYFPGMVTALAFPLIAFLYWKVLIKKYGRS